MIVVNICIIEQVKVFDYLVYDVIYNCGLEKNLGINIYVLKF